MDLKSEEYLNERDTRCLRRGNDTEWLKFGGGNLKALGQLVHESRISNHYTLCSLADSIGCSQATLINLESGNKAVSEEILLAVCKRLDISFTVASFLAGRPTLEMSQLLKRDGYFYVLLSCLCHHRADGVLVDEDIQGLIEWLGIGSLEPPC